MNEEEAQRLAASAELFGYVPDVRQLVGGSWRVYLQRPGEWTFVTSEEDLAEVKKADYLWVKEIGSMATEEPTPPSCASEVYNNGTLVMITNSIPSNALEAWVKKVAAQSGQPVDWHFAGGRACILALGNLGRVREAIEALLPEHDALQRKEYEGVLPDMIFRPSRTLYADNEINTAHEATRQSNMAERT